MASLLPIRNQSLVAMAGWAMLLWTLTIAIVAGCKKQDEIREYTLTNTPQPTPTHRMLAAIVTDEQPAADKNKKAAKNAADSVANPAGATGQAEPQAWFFKLVGPLDQIEKVAGAFDQFVSSIRTGQAGRPQWTLPEGWSEDTAARSPEFGREATIRIDQGGSPLELTVSKLAMPINGREGWMLGNINRWRQQQLKLPAIGRSELDEYTDEIKAGDMTAIKVDFRGVYAGAPMAGKVAANMAHGGARGAAAKVPMQPQTTSSSTDNAQIRTAMSLPFEAEVPTAWKPAPLKQFSVATYEIVEDDGERSAEMTVTPLGPQAGDLRMNVDRWRRAFKQPQRVEEQLTTIEVGGQKSDYVSLIGSGDASPREATLGVILPRPEAVWFFKLWGQADMVEREKQRFEEYVKSVRFK